MSGGGALHGLEEVGLSCNAKVVSIDYGCVSSDVDGADGLGEKKVKERRKGKKVFFSLL